MVSFFFYHSFLTVLSEKPTTFTITVTSEAGENDESKLITSYKIIVSPPILLTYKFTTMFQF